MYQEYRVSQMTGNEWKLPLNLAIGFHLLIIFGAIFLPGLLDNKPRFENIYTVNLINMADLPQPTPPAKASEPAQPPPKPPSPEAVSLARPEPAPAPEPAPPKAISIKPKKVKVKKEIVEPPKEEPPPPKPQPKPDLEKLQRERLAEMIRAEQEAAEQARIAEEQARIEKELLEATRRQIASEQQQPTPSPSTSGGASSQHSAIENRYYASVQAKLQQYWKLPEILLANPTLEAIVVITIRNNGDVADYAFLSKSGDPVFDRFVTKTLQDAAPLPAIPAAMKKQRLEFEVRFTPERIN